MSGGAVKKQKKQERPDDATMTVRLTKGGGPKEDTLSCFRPDGTCTWSRFIAQHDLVHYVVETELNLQNSFYALVFRGMNISDFNVPGATKALDLPPEAGLTEFVVGMLQMELAGGEEFPDFNDQVAIACRGRGAEPPDPIPPDKLARIRDRVRRLLGEWSTVEQGGFLEFPFPIVPEWSNART